MKPTDILLDQDGHIRIENGDFVIGDSTQQHQKHLLMAMPGDYKQSPLVGVGVAEQLDDENPDDLLRAIRTTFVQDGMTVKNLSIASNGNIEVDANY